LVRFEKRTTVRAQFCPRSDSGISIIQKIASGTYRTQRYGDTSPGAPVSPKSVRRFPHIDVLRGEWVAIVGSAHQKRNLAIDPVTKSIGDQKITGSSLN
jgi:hypothetical protein